MRLWLIHEHASCHVHSNALQSNLAQMDFLTLQDRYFVPQVKVHACHYSDTTKHIWWKYIFPSLLFETLKFVLPRTCSHSWTCKGIQRTTESAKLEDAIQWQARILHQHSSEGFERHCFAIIFYPGLCHWTSTVPTFRHWQSDLQSLQWMNQIEVFGFLIP